jgi:hypothetical protein
MACRYLRKYTYAKKIKLGLINTVLETLNALILTDGPLYTIVQLWCAVAKKRGIMQKSGGGQGCRQLTVVALN